MVWSSVMNCAGRNDGNVGKQYSLYLSPFLVKFTQILESILLDNPHKTAVLSVGCPSFSSTLFPSTQLSVNMLGYSTL